AARQHGVGRASFLVRVGEQIAGFDKATMTSFLVGVLAQVDLPLLEGSAWGSASPAPVVLYGGGHFHRVLVALIEGTGRDVRSVGRRHRRRCAGRRAGSGGRGGGARSDGAVRAE